MAYEAKIIADSICNGQRLTTMQLTHPRIVHSEFMTHCAFARNASSSRAIPFNVTIKRVFDDPFIPIWWGENQKGMQAANEIADWKKQKAIDLWLQARDRMAEIAKIMASTTCHVCNGEKQITYNQPLPCDICKGKKEEGCFTLPCYRCNGTGYSGETLNHVWPCVHCNETGEGLNIHKQIVNRLLEPFSWITVCVTGDWEGWSNYFALRCHPDAQKEIAHQAYMAQLIYFRGTPEVLVPGQWHLPYTTEEERARFTDDNESLDPSIDIEGIIKVSTGRTARTSYLTQEGKRDPEQDIALHNRLSVSVPKHMSPFEHVCQAMGDNNRYGKYKGWKAYRHTIADEFITNFQPNHPELV